MVIKWSNQLVLCGRREQVAGIRAKQVALGNVMFLSIAKCGVGRDGELMLATGDCYSIRGFCATVKRQWQNSE